MEFRTQFDRVRVFSEHGSPMVQEYSPVFDEKGNFELEESGTRNLYDEIQSHAMSADINVIMRMFEAGDTDILNQRNGFFADVTEFPKSYAEMLNIVINGEKEFDSLPLEIKEKFENNFAQFVSAIGTDEWYEKLGFVSQKEDIDNNVLNIKDVVSDE